MAEADGLPSTFSTDTTGFLAVDRTNRYIVLSFRGSSSVRNYLANLAFTTTPVELCAGCEVHDGFWSSWLEVQPTVIKAIQDARAANPGFPVVATGHSLGGAIATLAAARLRTLGIPAALVRISLSFFFSLRTRFPSQACANPQTWLTRVVFQVHLRRSSRRQR